MDNVASPLTAIAESFELLSKLVVSLKDSSEELRLDMLCDACSLVSVLFSSLGLAFKFAELEYVSKVIFLQFFVFYFVFLYLKMDERCWELAKWNWNEPLLMVCCFRFTILRKLPRST